MSWSRLVCYFRGHRWSEWRAWKVSRGVALLTLGGVVSRSEGTDTAKVRHCQRCGRVDMDTPPVFGDGVYRAVVHPRT